MTLKRFTVISILMALVIIIFASSCTGTGKESNEPTPQAQATEIIKPKPSVAAINASTTGMFDNYYAIVDVTIRNEGAEGMVIVIGSITQGSITKQNEFPLHVGQNASENVKFVFPLKWRGGDWTPKVETIIP